MTERPDDVELAIRHIRRVTKAGDLDQVLAVLNAQRMTICSRQTAFPRRSVNRNNGRVPNRRGQPPSSTLDPTHKSDPAFLAYIAANDALEQHCKRHAVPRGQVTGPIRENFEKALTDWLAVKPRYKISSPAAPATNAVTAGDGGGQPAANAPTGAP